MNLMSLFCQQEEIEKFQEIHKDFGVLEHYTDKKLHGRGAIQLPCSLI